MGTKGHGWAIVEVKSMVTRSMGVAGGRQALKVNTPMPVLTEAEATKKPDQVGYESGSPVQQRYRSGDNKSWGGRVGPHQLC